MPDPYLDPHTGTLRNKLGATTPASLRQAEDDLVSWRIVQLLDHPVVGGFDLDHLQAIHHHLFQDVYPWAGQLRTVNIDKGSTQFAPYTRLTLYGANIHTHIEEMGWLRTDDETRFTHRIAMVYDEVNYLHPFREGNGRTQRIWLGQLAAQAGWHIDWNAMDAQENIVACEAGISAIKPMMRKLVHRR